jgi:two-component system sensor histidine kinase/response regulator
MEQNANKILSTMQSDYNTHNILIVDDVPANLKILGSILKGEGYKVRPVPNGKLALQVAEIEIPDIILLDIMMPDMDGFEVCRRLKENPKLTDIPIIFISALNDTKDIVRALTTGGVDYIIKPFRAEEVIARVKTHIQIHQQSIVLRKQSKELHELIATKDKFFSIISHDLRGPMGGFMALTELMADDSTGLSPEEQKELTNELSKSARNIFNLLENLLEWSIMQQGNFSFKPTRIYLTDLVSECTKTLLDSIRKKDIHLSVDIPAEMQVYADLYMLQSVIRNIAANAIKFTCKGGMVAISADFTENKNLVIVVKDTGIGMNNEIKSNLFQLNKNTNRTGTEGEHSTGLGLILCKEFVEKHGGEIWVESEEGMGTSFYFTIPDHSTSMDLRTEEQDFEENENTNQLENLKILIAEDNENSGILIKILANSFSNKILEAVTGKEAVEMCQNNPDIDLILMDIKMPVLNGYEATRQIRTFNKDVIIIAQTAYGLDGEREKAKDAGCTDYILKPINKDQLIQIIRKYF